MVRPTGIRTVNPWAQEKKETIPEGRKVTSKETICLKVKADKNKNIANIKSSRSPVKELIDTFEKLQQKYENHGTSTPKERKSQFGNSNKLTETCNITSQNENFSDNLSISNSQVSENKLAGTSNKTSRNESFSDNPSVSNSQEDEKSVPRKQVIPEDGKQKPISSRKVWTKLKSGLFV